jgi:hypothetical protein
MVVGREERRRLAERKFLSAFVVRGRADDGAKCCTDKTAITLDSTKGGHLQSIVSRKGICGTLCVCALSSSDRFVGAAQKSSYLSLSPCLLPGPIRDLALPVSELHRRPHEQRSVE